jgi:hypothetical protein
MSLPRRKQRCIKISRIILASKGGVLTLIRQRRITGIIGSSVVERSFFHTILDLLYVQDSVFHIKPK